MLNSDDKAETSVQIHIVQEFALSSCCDRSLLLLGLFLRDVDIIQVSMAHNLELLHSGSFDIDWFLQDGFVKVLHAFFTKGLFELLWV